MRRTLEMRWFFRDRPFDHVQFFADSADAAHRVDWYAFPTDNRCGIKIREGRLETKLLVNRLGEMSFNHVTGIAESWSKWSVEFTAADHPTASVLESTGWIAVEKQRFLRCFFIHGSTITETPYRRPICGCEFEFTKLTVGGNTWWSVGFESVGDEEALESNLHRTVNTVFKSGEHTADFLVENSYAYPTWLYVIKELENMPATAS